MYNYSVKVNYMSHKLSMILCGKPESIPNYNKLILVAL